MEEAVILTPADLQTQYQNYKSTLQSLAQKVGEIEQEIEEHKSVLQFFGSRMSNANLVLLDWSQKHLNHCQVIANASVSSMVSWLNEQ